jgi:hypothetical protein
MRRIFALGLVALSLSAAVPAPGTCGPWVPQTNGTRWRMCTDLQNQLYCELKMGSKITRFVCPD